MVSPANINISPGSLSAQPDFFLPIADNLKVLPYCVRGIFEK